MTASGKKRCFTVMVIPHSEEATYSIKLPFYLLQITVGFLLLCVVGVVVLGYSYLRASVLAEEASTLRQINRTQQEEIDALAIETQRMLEQVQAIDELVELVTEKLDIEEDINKDTLQNQSYQSSAGLSESGYNGYERFSWNSFGAGGVLDRAAANLSYLQNIIPERSETLDLVEGHIDRTNARPLIWPARGRLSSGYGMRRIPYAQSGYQFHTGVDIVGAHGSDIMATAHGKVSFTGYRSIYGNLVIVEHGYGYETYYAHLSGFAVTAGEKVERGQVIGYMGASGRTTGTHLHYEVHHNGAPVNPYNYMKKQ
jgi:murein DD-endopeptidase MepM/ murein hydrolase activator NlpD